MLKLPLFLPKLDTLHCSSRRHFQWELDLLALSETRALGIIRCPPLSYEKVFDVKIRRDDFRRFIVVKVPGGRRGFTSLLFRILKTDFDRMLGESPPLPPLLSPEQRLEMVPDLEVSLRLPCRAKVYSMDEGLHVRAVDRGEFAAEVRLLTARHVVGVLRCQREHRCDYREFRVKRLKTYFRVGEVVEDDREGHEMQIQLMFDLPEEHHGRTPRTNDRTRDLIEHLAARRRAGGSGRPRRRSAQSKTASGTGGDQP